MTNASSDSELRILGIDPGLNITGYGVVQASAGGLRLVEAGVVRGRTRGSLTARVQEIYDGVRDVIASLSPQVLALEELYSHYQRPKTAILMGHARGVICLAGAQAGIRVVHYPSTQIKRILRGTATPRNPRCSCPFSVSCACRNSRNRPTWPMPWRWPCATFTSAATSGVSPSPDAATGCERSIGHGSPCPLPHWGC